MHSLRLRSLLIGMSLVAAAIGRGALAEMELTHVTPPPQPPLTMVSDSVSALRAGFNAADDEPRVLVLLSPT